MARIQLLTITLFFIINLTYFFLIFGDINLKYCCDATTYISGGKKILENGLTVDNPFALYRSYLNYTLSYGIERLGNVFGHLVGHTATQAANYVIGAAFIYTTIACLLVLFLGRIRDFYVVFIPLYLSPITLSLVVYPLQSSQIALLLFPLIVTIYMNLKLWRSAALPAQLLVFSGLAWMMKGAFIFIAVPVALVALFLTFRDWDRNSALSALLGVVIAGLLIGPQAYIAHEKRGGIYPYPDTAILDRQIGWGKASWHYQTVYDDQMAGNAKWRGEFSRNNTEPATSLTQYLSQAAEHPTEFLGLWVGHLFATFNYTNLKVYITEKQRQYSLFNVLIGMTAFLGLAYWMARIFQRGYRLEDGFLDIILIGSIVLVPLLAVETRFGFLAISILSIRFSQWCTYAPNDGRKIAEAVVAVPVGLLMAFAMLLMEQLRV